MISITTKIKNLMDDVAAMKTKSKKAKNKVHARLEEAWLWSKELDYEPLPEDSNHYVGDPPKPYMWGDDPNPPQTVGGLMTECFCPEGAVDVNCPVHGGKK